MEFSINRLGGSHWQLKSRQEASINSLLLDSHLPIQIAQDDMHSVALIGRVRPYGKPYISDSLPEVLIQLRSKPEVEDFYRTIAGFFILVIGSKASGHWRIVNDHLASLPLYWSDQGDVFRASTRISLLESSELLSQQAIYNYCYFHCIPSPSSIYAATSKLVPGTAISVSKDKELEEVRCYLPDYSRSRTNIDQLQEECRNLVSDLVAWNMTSDCGAFLSGGLDSSTVAGMMSKHSDKARTFSIGFRAKGYDETEYAEITARHFGTHHQTHYLEPAEIVENFEKVAAYFNEPFGNSSAMATYVCADFAKRNGVNILLAGDGGDELFAGNERYAKQKVFDVYDRLPGLIRWPVDKALYDSPLGRLPLLKKGHSYIKQARVPMPDRLHTYNFLNRMDVTRMFEEGFWQAVDTELPSAMFKQRFDESDADDFIDNMLYLDWKFTLADNDLVKVREMCEMAGVEVRFPLLEKELVDFSCKVPGDVKLPGMRLRDFYKKTFKGFLADATLSKPKHGFGLPFGVWMKEQQALRKLTVKTLNSYKTRGIMTPMFVDEALETYYSGHQGYYGELIWIMLVLEVWLTAHGVHSQ